MLTESEAEALVVQHLGTRPRAAHSREVARMLGALAASFGTDASLWRIVGLCHDLDYFDVDGDWTRHGVLTAERLAGRLPDEALAAIAAHDHRTGRVANTLLADMLRLADTLAVIDYHVGYAVLTRSANELRKRLGTRSYLADIIRSIAERIRLFIGTLVKPHRGAPEQRTRPPEHTAADDAVGGSPSGRRR